MIKKQYEEIFKLPSAGSVNAKQREIKVAEKTTNARFMQT